MWRATHKKFPQGPSDGLKRWSLGPLNDNPLEYFTRVACEYGDIAGLRVLNFKTIFINHPDLIEEVLVTNARKYSKGRVLRANRHVFGEGLLTSEGDFCGDRKSTRLNSSHMSISYAVFCLKKKNNLRRCTSSSTTSERPGRPS